MQSLKWYIGRLKSMSFAEVMWRIKSEILSVEERYRVYSKKYPRLDDECILSEGTGFSIIRDAAEKGTPPATGLYSDEWRDALLAKANDIVCNKLSFFDLKAQSLGDPINWQADHAAGKSSPLIYSKKIDYRDFNKSGDCKLVWEPNRHHQFVVLARAYRATGDEKYVMALISQLKSWLQENPFGHGMNWRSPLELGIRLINWVWALDLVADSEYVTDEFRKEILDSVYKHCWDITRKFSQGTSANNHLVGEAAGVYVAASYFHGMPHAASWRQQSKAILQREIGLQTYADGCTREQALGYEFFVLQFYLICGLVGRWSGDEFTPDYWQTLEKMYEFVACLSEGGDLPMFGDRDDGYVLDLGNPPHDIQTALGIAALLFQRSDFAAQADKGTETLYWLFGGDSNAKLQQFKNGGQVAHLSSRDFPDAGYYLLQYGQRHSGDEVSVLFDCGELGFGGIAAHGHADALSIVLRIGGRDVLVDPGTYDYFSYPQWRQYFRSTRAHNTIEVDGRDQSELLGPFLWGKKANSRCTLWQPDNSGGGRVEAQHDGYTSLSDPVIHSRMLELNPTAGELCITDRLLTTGKHELALYLHFSQQGMLARKSDHHYEIRLDDKALSLEMDRKFSCTEASGSSEPISGWFSAGYHQKTPITTLVARASITGDTEFCCRLSGL